MSTISVSVTATPTNVISTGSLVTGSSYRCRYQAHGVSALMYLVEAANAPEASDGGTPIQHLEDVTLSPVDGKGLWAWTGGTSGTLWINPI